MGLFLATVPFLAVHKYSNSVDRSAPLAACLVAGNAWDKSNVTTTVQPRTLNGRLSTSGHFPPYSARKTDGRVARADVFCGSPVWP